MKKRLLLRVCCLLFVVNNYAQTHISYLYDSQQQYTPLTISTAKFEPYKKTINKGLDQGIYWIKIEDVQKPSVVKFENSHITNGQAFDVFGDIEPQKNEQFLSFLINRSPTYIKLKITKEAYIPIQIKEQELHFFSNKKELLFIGLYVGFAIVIILINLFCFIHFSDNTFLYYSLFLFGVTFAFVLRDGIFALFSFNQNMIDHLTLCIHIFAASTGAFFAQSYLQTSSYYPKLKYVNVMLILFQLICFVFFVLTNSFIYYLFLDVLVFSLLGIYLIISFYLYRENVFTKIFAFAYLFIFLLGLDYYVLNALGIDFIQISRHHIKIAGFFEMILLSYAVILRMKILHDENKLMQQELMEYASEMTILSSKLNQSKNEFKSTIQGYNLTIREEEIFILLSEGKTNKEISEELFVSENTVKYHIKNIYTKLNIKSRKEAKNMVLN